MSNDIDNSNPHQSIGELCLKQCIQLVNNMNEQRKNASKFKDVKKEEKNLREYKLLFKETKSIKSIRVRSFSHWPHKSPGSGMMSSNGWFSCNVSDRVICIYCNQICHNWKKDDDPWITHYELSPTCPFIISKSSEKSFIPIVNDTFEVSPNPVHPTMNEYPRRSSTFNQDWNQITPSIEEFARAGFFNSGNNNVVTCFYCGGSLQNWGTNDNPMIEHIRWFPHCQYAKQLCGLKLYNQIQLSKKKTESNSRIDQISLSRLIASRFDLPVVKRLLSFYSLSIIKRCIQDQLTIKQNDFESDADLFIACLILQKQINIIQGNKEKLIVPSNITKITIQKTIQSFSNNQNNNCLICLCEEKQLACIPCGHLCACVPCAHSLRSCPICRQQIQSFIRIYS